MKPSFALIGPGKVGCAIGRKLFLAGYPLTAVIGRSLESATAGCHFIAEKPEPATTYLSAATRADIILLATKDGQLAEVAHQLSTVRQLRREQTLVHFSGLLPAEILRTGDSPVTVISIHPLLPFADREMATERLNGCPCAIEGDSHALQLAHNLVAAWYGLPLQIQSEKKALYHAGACIASNFTVTLAATACQLLASCGIEAEKTAQVLQPLMAATIDNFAKLGPQQGLTGPIVRGDAATVANHLTALQDQPQLAELYRSLAAATLELAEASDRLSAASAEQTKQVIGN